MKNKSPKPVAVPLRKQTNVSGQASAPPAYGIDYVDRQSNSKDAIVQGVFESSPEESFSVESNDKNSIANPSEFIPNNTGLPANLKTGIESLSGYSMDDVRVHYNSAKAAQMLAYAYTQGTDIHVASGQEKHLPHEAWHVVQQKQGRVKPTMQLKGKLNVNDDKALEKEADTFGAKAIQTTGGKSYKRAAKSDERNLQTTSSPEKQVLQRKMGFEYEIGAITTQRLSDSRWKRHEKGDVLVKKPGYEVTADEFTDDRGVESSQLEIIIKEIDEKNVFDRANLIAVTVPDVIQTINDIARASYLNYTLADQIPNLNGNSRDLIRSLQDDGLAMMGQLQMTGGLTMANLPEVVSGRAADNYIGAVIGATNFWQNEVLKRYKSNVDSVWNHAVSVVDHHGSFGAPITLAEREQLAAVVTLIARIPINARIGNNIPYPKGLAGELMARTDFSKLMMMLPDSIKGILTKPIMRNLVIATINNASNYAVSEHYHVMPVFTKFERNAGVPNMEGLKIGEWVDAMLPSNYENSVFLKGKDLMTKKNFPGSKLQKEWIESMGSYGEKTDPGNKAIFELRSLPMVPVFELPDTIEHLLNFFP